MNRRGELVGTPQPADHIMGGGKVWQAGILKFESEDMGIGRRDFGRSVK
jgi:hypothetical protein